MVNYSRFSVCGLAARPVSTLRVRQDRNHASELACTIIICIITTMMIIIIVIIIIITVIISMTMTIIVCVRVPFCEMIPFCSGQIVPRATSAKTLGKGQTGSAPTGSLHFSTCFLIEGLFGYSR